MGTEWVKVEPLAQRLHDPANLPLGAGPTLLGPEKHAEPQREDWDPSELGQVRAGPHSGAHRTTSPPLPLGS